MAAEEARQQAAVEVAVVAIDGDVREPLDQFNVGELFGSSQGQYLPSRKSATGLAAGYDSVMPEAMYPASVTIVWPLM